MSQKYEYFGKYILLEKLATGGMAEVFLARAPGAGGIAKFVAIKRILPQFSDNQEFIDMFRDEAKIAINLSHSNIVSIYEFGIEKGQFFLVMDYVEGRNLRQILNKMKKAKSKFSAEQIIYLIKEVAAGLDHAHRCLDGTTGKPLNITHRDMSPQNVMLSFEGETKIVDFGIAKAETQLETTRAGTLKGKFGYMSPEQAEGQPVDLRTDIFSLGIVLWELLANDRLFIANNEINTLRKIRDCQVPSLRKINPNIHAELERICMKALARDRNLRYQTAAALHRDLNRFLNRQYPDFSQQDLAVFIKTLYADEILETRKRLVQYAQIPFRDGSGVVHIANLGFPEDKTVVTSSNSGAVAAINQTSTQTETDVDGDLDSGNQTITDSDMDLYAKNELTDPDAVEATVAKPSPTTRKPSEEVTVNANVTGLDIKALAREMRTPVSARVGIRSGSFHTATNVKGGSGRGGFFTLRSPIRPVLILTAVTVCAYLLLDMVMPEQTAPLRRWLESLQAAGPQGPDGQEELPSVNGGGRTQPPPPVEPIETEIVGQDPAITETPPPQPVTKPAPPPVAQPDPEPVKPPPPVTPVVDKPTRPAIDPATLPSVTSIVINSSPSGADIFVAGRNTGKTTPARVEVPGNRPFELTLKKDRYIDYNVPNFAVVDMQGKSFTATLQRALVAYIDIDVKPPHNARILLNGQKLGGERLPITRYAVPAGTPIVIRAENPVAGTSAEKTLVLRQDERKAVVFVLKKDDSSSGRRQPSGSN